MLEKKLTPIVVYITDTDITNKKDINSEAKEIKKDIVESIPGMEAYDQIVLRAYNDYPDEITETYMYYDSIQKN